MARTQYSEANFYTKCNGEWVLSEEFKLYHAHARYADYGSPRRKLLMELFERGLEFPVNRRGCPNMKHDTDLQKLLKDGKIEMFNVRRYDSHKTTHVRLKRK